MTDSQWFGSLKAGDTVYIRNPWFDGVHPGGELHKRKVTAIHSGGIVFVTGFGRFHPKSWKAHFNAHIERTTLEVEAEYKAQRSRVKSRSR